ncbi:hypothetical protein [Pseudodonghicola xiamenensis]|nr:hypothetical protein [Pseudodonghicola xiamenensis]
MPQSPSAHIGKIDFDITNRYVDFQALSLSPKLRAAPPARLVKE